MTCTGEVLTIIMNLLVIIDMQFNKSV